MLILAVFFRFVHNGFMNFFGKKVEKAIDISCKNAIINRNCTYSLIKSGGGNGPMKPGNLLIQGAKSGGKREMRIR
jgi:hypothetical protein